MQNKLDGPEDKSNFNGFRNIIFLGLISCFADISAEMVYPIIPLYLTAVLGATPALVGVIEGIAESVASLLKVFSGYLSDRFQHKKLMAFTGYASGVVYKIVLLLVPGWGGVLAGRVIDRLGKGIRTAPRDVMVTESASEGHMGGAFGIHKMLDMLGSATGIFIAFLLVRSIGEESYRLVFLVSLIPIAIALFIFIFVKEKKTTGEPAKTKEKREPFWKNASKLDAKLKLYLAVTFIFTLGNSSNSFLLLRAENNGYSSSGAIFLYFIYTAVASVLAVPCGRLSDKIGRKKLLVGGYITFSIVYAGFAFCTSKPAMAVIFILYGLFTAMTAGVERAFVAEIAPPELKGTMLGLQAALAGIALLPASLIAGQLWDHISPAAPFVYGAVLSMTAAAMVGIGFSKYE
ncbi:MAG: MFS transporter [Anaerovoracaceae bacterium]|jgi:MFS family permease